MKKLNYDTIKIYVIGYYDSVLDITYTKKNPLVLSKENGNLDLFHQFENSELEIYIEL